MPSGKIVFANCGIVGIDADGKVYGGYDQGIELYSRFSYSPFGALTDKEMIELAALLLIRWQEFKIKMEASHDDIADARAKAEKQEP